MSQIANRLNNATLALAEDTNTSKIELTHEFFRALILFLNAYVSGSVSSVVNTDLSEIDISYHQ